MQEGSKNDEGRCYPITAAIEVVLKAQLIEHERMKKAGKIVSFVFHRNGKRIKNFRKAWDNAATTAGHPGKLLHDFRRSNVRNLERAGVPRSSAKAIVGHKTDAIYERYAIVDAAIIGEAADKIDRVDRMSRGQTVDKSTETENPPISDRKIS